MKQPVPPADVAISIRYQIHRDHRRTANTCWFRRLYRPQDLLKSPAHIQNIHVVYIMYIYLGYIVVILSLLAGANILCNEPNNLYLD